MPLEQKLKWRVLEFGEGVSVPTSSLLAKSGLRGPAGDHGTPGSASHNRVLVQGCVATDASWLESEIPFLAWPQKTRLGDPTSRKIANDD